MPHLTPLDTLRALAIILVVLFHSPVPLFQLECGWMGVNLFFILSGFLITSILLRAKDDPHSYFANFYWRRLLRIVPLYLLYLILTCIVLAVLEHNTDNKFIDEGWDDFSNHWHYLFSFTYNFQEIVEYLRHRDYNNSYFFGHLWTLSVEAQFYLVFPALVYFLSRKQLKVMIILAIIVTPILRVLFVSYAVPRVSDLFWIGDVLYTSSLFQFDTLALGASLAVFDFNWSTRKLRATTVALFLIMIAVGLYHLSLANEYGVRMLRSSLGFDNPTYHTTTLSPNAVFNNRYAYATPLINFGFASLVLLSLRLKDRNIFRNALLRRIAKVSYGIYIYHLAISFFAGHMAEHFFHLDLSGATLSSQLAVFLSYVAVLYTLATMSFRYFESWFLKFRESMWIDPVDGGSTKESSQT